MENTTYVHLEDPSTLVQFEVKCWSCVSLKQVYKMLVDFEKPLDLSGSTGCSLSKAQYPLKKRILWESTSYNDPPDEPQEEWGVDTWQSSPRPSPSPHTVPHHTSSHSYNTVALSNTTPDKSIRQAQHLAHIKEEYHRTPNRNFLPMQDYIQFQRSLRETERSRSLLHPYPMSTSMQLSWGNSPRPLTSAMVLPQPSQHSATSSPDSACSARSSRKYVVSCSPPPPSHYEGGHHQRTSQRDVEDSTTGSRTPDSICMDSDSPSSTGCQVPLSGDGQDFSDSGNASKRSRICSICSSPTETFHLNYGASSCFSCRAFFRRSVQKARNPNFQCRAGETCVINMQTRSDCRKCRYDLCLKSGMRPEYVMNSEQKQARFRKHIKKMQREEKKRAAE
eukprot:maker-scaffold757_size101632-snap-gene-0.27 protein:Tk09873 transcript:maker-scaffold757_size101632-snap-gene-0.27-mRNA-1 annotation:"ecdysone receptor-like"